MLVVHDPRTLAHRVPPGFPERPERVSTVVRALAKMPRFRLVDASHDGPDEEAVLTAVAAIHAPSYVERLRRAVARGDGLLDTADNPLSAGTFDAAVAATGASLVALERSLAGERAAFGAIRPPGHHAERSSAMGFCFFNHAAVAAQRAIALGCERVAIVDLDVHHGNGTQHLFEERGDVLYASAHQYPFYPGTGAASERGRGPGEGLTVNVPLAAGGGDGEWLAALDETILPAVERFAPELVIVSAGFDAWRGDPLGGMRVTEAGFAGMGARLFDLAERRAGGRILFLLEGGYDVEALPRLATAMLDGGVSSRVERDR